MKRIRLFQRYLLFILNAKKSAFFQCIILLMLIGFWQVSDAEQEGLYTNKPVLSLAAAKKGADACEAMAISLGLKLSVAIVDDGAHLMLFRRMSGASLASADIALGKAVTASRTELNTRHLAEYVHGKDGGQKKNPGLAYLPSMVTLSGGLPIKVKRQVIAGIGVSGASADHDEACAQAALNALQSDDKGAMQ